MDVHQLALLARQPSAALAERPRFWGMPKRGLALILANALFWQPLLVQAEGIAAANPATQVGQAGNGVPVVNIAAPNGSGLSHNQYQQYNVDGRGVILNNATHPTQATQLGGIVVGNPNLQGRAAGTILNEVTGANATQLKGYTEVAGQSARVIVANPHGITCNGCGFINTPQVTLSTGKPVLDGNGQVQRYNVQGGSVSIDGAGLNATNVDQFDIITRSAKINAELYANTLNVITGRNDVDAQTLAATALPDDGSARPELAIDSSALGGMYAGAVKLVGTEAGVGVKLAGNVAASGGDIQIDANGQLTVGQTAASGNIAAKARDITVTGPAYAGNQLSLTASGKLDNSQQVVAAQAVVLQADQLNNRGTVQAGINPDNTRNSTGTVSAKARQVVNPGTLAASQAVTVKATQQLDNRDGKLVSDGTLNVDAARLDNRKGVLSSAGAQGVNVSETLDNRGGRIVTDATLSLSSASLDNAGGALSASQALGISTGRLGNSASGRITSGAALTLDATAIDNLGGLLSGLESVNIKAARLDNSAGTLVSNGNVTLDLVERLTNLKGDIASGGDLLLQGRAEVDNQGGRVTSKGLMTLLTANLDNRNQGTLAGSTTLITASGQVQNGADGLINSQAGALTLTAGRLDNSGGTVQSAGSLSVTGPETLNIRGNLIAQAGDLQLTGANLDNRSGVLASLKGAVGTELSGVLRNGVAPTPATTGATTTASATTPATAAPLGGAIQGERLLLVARGGLDNQGGDILAQKGDALLQTATLDNRNGALSAKRLMQVRGAGLDNSGGQLSGADIDLGVTGVLANRAGIIESSGALTVSAASLDNTQGRLRALGTTGTTALTVGGALDNSAGQLESANSNLQFAIGRLLNANGSILHVGNGVLGLELAHLQNVGGRVATNGSLTLNGAEWTNSSVLQAANLNLNIDRFTQTGSGQLLAGKTFTGRGSQWRNDGLIASDGTLDVRLGGTYSGAGRMTSLGAFSLKAAQLNLDSATARLAGGGTTTIDIDGILANRGIITSATDLRLSASTLNNLGSLGAAGNLTVSAPTLLNQNGLIFSGANMGLWVNDFTNQSGDVYSVGNLQISRDAQGTPANSIVNRSATLTSDGSMLLAARRIDNIRDVLTVDDAGIYNARIDEIACGTAGLGNLDCSGGKEHHVWKIQQNEKLAVTAASAPSSITAGVNLDLVGGDVLNSSSAMAAGGALSARVNNLNNVGLITSDTQTDRIFVSSRTRNDNGWQSLARAFNEQYSQQGTRYNAANLGGLQAAMSTFISTTEREATHLRVTTPVAFDDQTYAAVIQAGGAVNIQAGNNIGNNVVRGGFTYVSGGTRTDTTAPGSAYATLVPLDRQLAPDLAQRAINPTTLPGFSLPTGQNGLFRLSDTQASGLVQGNGAQLLGAASSSQPHRYLIETNPALTNLRQFLSSNYLLDSLGIDADTAWKRLGDGYYEQRLVQQAVVARTGQRFINNLASDEAMFKYLMDNAIASKTALNLSVGVALSGEQVAALTHDIVWMEDQVVRGEHVLVPVLYLAQANNRLAANGALIQGNELSLIAGNSLTNVGVLKATSTLQAGAGNSLINEGLIETRGRLALQAGNDLLNRAGGLVTGRDVSLSAVTGDVTNERTVIRHQSATGASTWREDFAHNAARVEAAGDLSVRAERDINNSGVMQAAGNAALVAGRDVNIAAAQTQEGRVNGPNHTRSSVTQLGAELSAGQNVGVQAGRDINVVASRVEAKGDLAMVAGNNLNIASAANEDHSYSKTKKVTAQEDHVHQVGSQLTAGDSAALSARNDITLTASGVKAGDEAYVYAGNDLSLLAAQNSDYSLYDMKKKGSFGAKKTQRDEVTDIRHVGSRIVTGGDLLLVSEGNQRYQAAQLGSGNDLSLESGGAIAFEGVKDLHQESHEKSKSDLAWNSMKGKGSTDETLRQTRMIAKGERAIRAVQGLQIDVKQVDQQTVSQAIDAMVKADPQLAWLKDAEQRGDVDWRQVKEVHDSFKYSHSGLGQGAMLAIIIIVTVVTAGAGTFATAGAAAGTAASGAAGAVVTTTSTLASISAAANAATVAGLTSLTSQAAVSTINNKGNLGDVFKDVTSSDAIKGYAIAGGTAGLTAGYFDDWTGTRTDVASGKVIGPKLYTWEGVGQFAANQALQNGTSMMLSKALGQGGSASDSLKNALFNTLAAASFNTVGDYTRGIENGSLQKIAIHAMVGGLLSSVTGGDFRTGALAAGANEALVVHLNELVDGNEELLTMSSQIVGLLAAASQEDVDAEALEKATWVAKNATQYNFLGDHSAKQRDEVREKYRQEGTAQQARELIGLEGADHRSDNLLEAYQRNPALLTKDDMAELSAYLQVYVHEQTLAGGEQAAQINLNQLLNGSRVPVYGYPYAGLGEDKSAWVDAELGSVGRYLGRDKSTNEKTYDSAKGLLLIDANQRAAAEVGNPALYFLAGPLGGAIRAAAATNGALQFAQGGKQAVEGDSWNAAGNMVMGALGMATVGIPQTVTNVGKGSPATAGSKAPSSALFSPDAEAGMPYSHPVKAVSGPKAPVSSPLKLGETRVINDVSMTRVGRWMSADELAQMQNTNRVVQGGGGQTFISTNGIADFKGAAPKDSVYVEFDVPANSLLQGGKDGWFKMIGPDAGKSQQFLLNKQGGEYLPAIKGIEVLDKK